MADGTYFNGSRYVSASEFRRPAASGKPKAQRKQPPTPQPKETTDVSRSDQGRGERRD
jgi:hypothetical protein